MNLSLRGALLRYYYIYTETTRGFGSPNFYIIFLASNLYRFILDLLYMTFTWFFITIIFILFGVLKAENDTHTTIRWYDCYKLTCMGLVHCVYSAKKGHIF